MGSGEAAPEPRLTRLADAAEDELQRIIPFWLGLRDSSGGGFAGEADSLGRPLWSAVKGAVLQARILWFFSQAYRRFGDPQLLDAASWAWRFIAAHLVDPEHGGVFWAVTADGAPAAADKHLYAQAFAIHGLAAFHQASGDPDALRLAQQLWRTVEDRAADPDHAGYFESFSVDWRPRPNHLMGRPEAAKSFNAHFHLLEAYGALWEVWPDPALRSRIEILITLLTGPMLDRRWNTFRQFFQADWSALDDGGSFGHDIEGAWLIPALAGRLSASAAAAAAAAVSGLAEAVADRAQEQDGGLITGVDAVGRLDRSKAWWVQAEALVGFLDAFERGGDRRFLEAAEAVWSFIDRSIIDRAHGEWRWRIDAGADAPANLPKAHLWKCPYHNGRACLELMERAKRPAG